LFAFLRRKGSVQAVSPDFSPNRLLSRKFEPFRASEDNATRHLNGRQTLQVVTSRHRDPSFPLFFVFQRVGFMRPVFPDATG